MKIWEVDYIFKEESETNNLIFGSYDSALIWMIEHAEELSWASIMDNEYIPCDPDKPEGQLEVYCSYYEKYEHKHLLALKKVYTDICPKMDKIFDDGWVEFELK